MEQLKQAFETALADPQTFMRLKRLGHYYEDNTPRAICEAIGVLSTLVEQKRNGFDHIFLAHSRENLVVEVKVSLGADPVVPEAESYE